MGCTALCRTDLQIKILETSWLHVSGKKCRTCSCSFVFSLPRRSFSPLWPLAFLSFPPPLQNFHVVLLTKKCLLCLLSLALFLVEFRWPVASFLFFFSLCFSLYSKFLDITINLRLIFQTTRIKKQFPLSGFVFIDSLVVCLCFTRRGWLYDFRPK